jgi:uncharacterized protein
LAVAVHPEGGEMTAASLLLVRERKWQSMLWWAVLALLCTLWLGHAQAQTLQPVPALTARVIDLSDTLTPAATQQLQSKLQALEVETGAQVVILMLASTAPEDIAAYTNRVASSWKIGRKAVGDGVLIVVAKQDRRMRIEVARRLEGAIPDILAARIIDQAMKPAFRNDNYAGGLDAAIDQLSLLIHGEQLPAPDAGRTHKSGAHNGGAQWLLLLPLSFLGLLLGAPLSRAIFGKGLGALLMGAGMGSMGYWLSHNGPVALATGLIGMLFVVLGNANRRSAGRYAGSRSKRRGTASRGRRSSSSSSGYASSGSSWSSSSSSSSDSWSSSSSDSFSSGGGGSFGGGGASGDW